jgi:acetylglutamate kinase
MSGGAFVVYKLGGPALEDPELLAPLAADIVRANARVAIVHGGGRHVDRTLAALGIDSRFVGGRRETSAEAMEVVEMVLSGVMNKAVAAGLTRAGVPAIGLSGRDGGLIRARLELGLGRVGIPIAVSTAPLFALWGAGFTPVVSPVSCGPWGEAVNVNADEAALAIARALKARSLVYLSDVDGVRVGASTLDSLDAAEAERRIADGTIAGGMALKVRAALDAAASGIGEVVVAGKARLLGSFAGTRLVHASAVNA